MEIFTVWIVYTHLEQIMHLRNMKEKCENNGYCSVEMPTKCNKILKI